MDYVVYTQYEGQKAFRATDLYDKGQVGNVLYATTFYAKELQKAKEMLQKVAKLNPDIKFQLRENKTGKIVWASK